MDQAALEYYRSTMQSGTNFLGYTTLSYASEIGALIDKHAATRLLDYGCGRGWQYEKERIHERWGIPIPERYDPHWEPFWGKPGGTFDGVICVDVMEHVPEQAVGAVLDELFAFAERFLFVTICCRAATKKMPDGRNVHLTVRPQNWWLSKLRRRERDGLELVVRWTN